MNTEDKKTLIELCEFAIRTQRERLETLYEEFEFSPELVNSVNKMLIELSKKEIPVNKLRQEI